MYIDTFLQHVCICVIHMRMFTHTGPSQTGTHMFVAVAKYYIYTHALHILPDVQLREVLHDSLQVNFNNTSIYLYIHVWYV